MARWDAPLEVEQVKQLALITRLSTHHGKPPPLGASSRRNHCSSKITSPFSTASTHSGHQTGPLVVVRKSWQLQTLW
jgi:hypothetical protein